MILAIAAAYLGSKLAAFPTGQETSARAVQPAGNPGSWVTPDDYPPAALRANQSGPVGVRLSIDSAGTVTGCTIIHSSGAAALDDATCALLLRRARFTPAIDGSGKAIASSWSTRFRWEIPKAEPVPVANWRSAAVITVSMEGRVLSCEDRSSGLIPAQVGPPCDSFRGQLPPDMLRGVGWMPGDHPITIEAAMHFDGLPEPQLDYRDPGQVIRAHVKVRFEVSEAGDIENCNFLPTGEEGWMAAMLPDSCAELTDKMVPRTTAEGKPQRSAGTFEIAVSRKK